MIKMTVAAAIAATFVASAAVAAPASRADVPATAQGVSPLAMFDKVMKPKGPRPKCTSTCRRNEDTGDQDSLVASKKKQKKSFIIGITRNKGVKKPKPKTIFPSRD